MKPVMQTEFYSEDSPEGLKRGNCMQAVIASLMEFPIEAVPPFHKWFDVKPQGKWGEIQFEWLLMLGKEMNCLWEQPSDDDERYFYASGTSPRYDGRIRHACIWHKGKIVHDPHPDGTGLVDITSWQWIENSNGQ